MNKTKEFEFVEKLTAELSSDSLIFPTSMNATMRIRHALTDPDASINHIVHIISAEPVLSAQLLRLSNSAAFNNGNNKPVTELRTAISRVGFAMARNVAISVGMQQMLQSQAKDMPPAVEALWTRTMRIAAACYVIAKHMTKLNPDTAMLVGLLHDVGKFYILGRASTYADMFTDEAGLWEIINQWHSNIVEVILDSWEIPKEISVAVRDGLDPERTHQGPPDLSDVLVVAGYLDASSVASHDAKTDDAELPPALIALRLTPDIGKELTRAAQMELGRIFQAIR